MEMEHFVGERFEEGNFLPYGVEVLSPMSAGAKRYEV